MQTVLPFGHVFSFAFLLECISFLVSSLRFLQWYLHFNKPHLLSLTTLCSLKSSSLVHSGKMQLVPGREVQLPWRGKQNIAARLHTRWGNISRLRPRRHLKTRGILLHAGMQTNSAFRPAWRHIVHWGGRVLLVFTSHLVCCKGNLWTCTALSYNEFSSFACIFKYIQHYQTINTPPPEVHRIHFVDITWLSLHIGALF